ncbi:MAG: R2-like ligand-binding oxidase [Gemmatimonadaceae bacterium]
MAHPFSERSVVALGHALNQSAAYRHAARHWEGGLVLEAQADPAQGLPQATAVFLDLDRGTCRAARLATLDDRIAARFVITGALVDWMEVLNGGMAPTMAIMRGRLALLKGSLAGLLPQVSAATALLKVAHTVLVQAEQDAAAGATGPAEQPAEAVASIRGAAGSPHPTSIPARLAFQSTSPTGLRFDSVPMRLWDKAKRLGIWNPADIDFTQDRRDWDTLAGDERDLLLRLASLFQAGEEAVVIDILPLLDVVAQEGRLEEQLYLTSFIWEEAKHVEGMRRFLDAVGAGGDDLSRYHTASYRHIFVEALPEAMQRLRADRSPMAQARASATYNMIVEGVLAETGYHTFHRILSERGIMPGMQQMAGHLKQDESRHIAYGIFLLSRLVADHGEPVWQAVTETMNALLDPAVTVISEAFNAYPADATPFGLLPDPFINYATRQFDKRLQRLERALAHGLADTDELEDA